MAKKNKGGGEEGGSWMDTYGDMVTLILTFFVLLYSMSTMDKTKFQYIAQAFSSAGAVINEVVAGEKKVEDPTGNLIEEAQLNAGEVPETFEQLYQFLQQAVEEAGLSDSVEISQSDSSVYLQFRDNIFFSPNSSILLQEGKDTLDLLIPAFLQIEDQILGMRVNGHTATSATSNVDDISLSTSRAANVAIYIRDIGGFNSYKIASSGYGHNRPIADNDTEEGRSMNRRVEMILINKGADFSDPKVLEDLMKMEFGEDFVFETDSPEGQGMTPEEFLDSVAENSGVSSGEESVPDSSLDPSEDSDAGADVDSGEPEGAGSDSVQAPEGAPAGDASSGQDVDGE